jgi:hypothetical protein
MAQFSVGGVDGTPGSRWWIHRDSDTVNAPISISLTPSAVGPDPLDPIAVGPFGLAVKAAGGATLTIDASVWDFTPPVDPRPFVSEFAGFVDAVEAVEGRQLAVGTGEALRVVLATRTPCTFTESMLLRYGLVRTAGANPTSYVDLLPGMRLQIDSAISQFVPSSSGPLAGINGYVAAAQPVTEVVSTRAGIVVANPFLAGNTVPSIDPGVGGAGSVLDLQAQVSGRHLRVCYPKSLGPSSGPGSLDTSQNVAVLGADTFATLDAATGAYYSGTAMPSGATATSMRGRAILTPLIAISLNGATSYVPVGTTARQVLERMTAMPRLAGTLDASNIKLARTDPQVLLPGGDVASIIGVSLAAAVAGTVTDGWDIPLFGGDTLTMTVSDSSATARVG